MSLTQTQKQLLEGIQNAVALDRTKTFDYSTEYLGYLPFGMYHWISVNGKDIGTPNVPFEFSSDDLDKLEVEGHIRKTDHWVDPKDGSRTKTTYVIE
ncbi:hypothetical protein LOC68_20035 [Blastopirellula sp. JC732]|uniref:Uncharacterized protein n=1 Tax=Blastopirellula sediminis TaxID=2894196 RepID=A0A9X1MQ48_9BACT|nr:hypothetical protein [Blastopirellula sediminis]MCC9606010.1 hypothetical protein [Blastopirellula sediminis]MCC9630691.1 hypothetical protein [Blastopirellula sediminis]